MAEKIPHIVIEPFKRRVSKRFDPETGAYNWSKYKLQKRVPPSKPKRKSQQSGALRPSSSREQSQQSVSLTQHPEDDLPGANEETILNVSPEEPLETCTLSSEERYHQIVLNRKAYSVHLKVVVIPHWLKNKQELRSAELVAVGRKPVFFSESNGMSWVSWCTKCDIVPQAVKMKQRIVHGSASESTSSCIHLYVASRLWEHFDMLHDIMPQPIVSDEDDTLNLPEVYQTHQNMVAVFSSNTPAIGIIKCNNEVLYCIVCRKNSCCHIVPSNLDPESEEYAEYKQCLYDLIPELSGTSATKRYTMKCVSYKLIPFSRSDLPANVCKSPRRLEIDGVINLYPVEKHCPKCDSLMSCTQKQQLRLFSIREEVLYATVHTLHCRPCNHTILYDGLDDGLLHMSSFLVSYDILRSVMHSFIEGKRPLVSWHNCWRKDTIDIGNTKAVSEFTYSKLRLAWQSFLRLLKMDNENFACRRCSPDDPSDPPPVVVCDGTAIAFQRRMLPPSKETYVSATTTLTGFDFGEDIYIKSGETRNLLLRYARGGKSQRSGVSKIFPLTEVEFNSLLAQLSSYPHLLKLIRKISVDDKCPAHYCHFIEALSSMSSITSFLMINDSTTKLFDSIIFKNHAITQSFLTTINEEMPLLYEVLIELHEPHVPSTLKDLLKDIWKKCQHLHQKYPPHPEENISMTTTDTLGCFPTLPLLRERGTYTIDKKQEPKTNDCKKRYPGHPSLLPGIMALYCPHGISMGFEVMTTHESPNIPFTIMKTRFKKAPRIVVYDNACILHRYVMKRDPGFFNKTRFYIDRLHWYNHKACSQAYKLEHYPQHKALNSQVCEQGNALLGRIKDQLSYMTQDNFMLHVKFFLWARNVEKKERSLSVKS